MGLFEIDYLLQNVSLKEEGYERKGRGGARALQLNGRKEKSSGTFVMEMLST